MIHRIIPKQFFMNNETINIFTDASIANVNGIWVGAPGAHAYYGGNYFTKKIKCIYDFTVNESELEAIYTGILLGLQINEVFHHGKEYRINIFSDSMISIKGLTEWVFSWSKNCVNGIWYNYSGDSVANQYLFMEIIEIILKYKPMIKFYHLKGHYDNCINSTGINMSKISKLNEFKESFSKTNKLPADTTIDNETARFFIMANTAIDEETRRMVNRPTHYNYKLKMFPRFVNNPFTQAEMNEYRRLIM